MYVDKELLSTIDINRFSYRIILPVLFIYSSARVKEYFESSIHKGSGYKLLYEVSRLIL